MKHAIWALECWMIIIIVDYGSTCPPPTPPYGSTIIYPLKQGIYGNGSTVLFGCKQGFLLVGKPMIKCTGTTWTQSQFTCKELRSCARLQAPSNGTIHGTDTTHGSTASFSCWTGFDLFGLSTLTCTNGVWSGNVPSCKAYCVKMRDPPNGRVIGTRFSHGRVVSFKCNSGYQLVGKTALRCIDGRWNSTVPTCKALLCPKPIIPSNSYIIYPQTNQINYTHGTQVFLACSDGHYLKGSPIMVCNQTVWFKREFNCIAFCPAVPLINNAVITHITLKDGGEVQITCHTNHKLVGSSKLRCVNGRWNGTLPSCKVITCADPGRPVNGRQAEVSNNFAVGGFVRFECNTNYTLVGQEVLICKRDQTWNKDIPKCLAPCVDPGHPINGRRIGSVFLHDSVVQFECNGNRLLKGSFEIKCNNGQWDAESPTCLDCFPLGMESGRIPDSSITASSQTEQHPAQHGRLGRDTYWCSTSEKRRDHIEIRFPKRYKITEARVQITQNSGMIRITALAGEVLPERWMDYHYEQPLYNSDVKRIVAKKQFIAQSLQIKIIKKARVPVCLRAEVYGCIIPRGCIMRGSAVLIKENSGYSKGYVRDIYRSFLDVLLVKTGYAWKAKDDVILDEKPTVHVLAKGTFVLGEDVNSPGLIREGIIEQIDDSVCTIKSKDERWMSNLNDVRVVKKSDFCP